MDWTGRQVAVGKTGSIPNTLQPILTRIGLEPKSLVELTTCFSSLFFLVPAVSNRSPPKPQLEVSAGVGLPAAHRSRKKPPDVADDAFPHFPGE